MPDHEIVLLAGLIADGGLTRDAEFTYARARWWRTRCDSADGGDRRPLARARKSPDEPNFQASSERRPTPGGNPVTELCRRHGIWGKRSEDKFVPEAIFGLGDRDIARFLGILFACDGHIYATDRLRQIGYSTISERLARDVQHLLLRLGIVSCIRTLKRDGLRGHEKVAREVRITGQDGISASATSSTSPARRRRPAARSPA